MTESQLEEHRQATRAKRLKEGRVVFNSKRSVLSCIVRDASKFGARVTIGEPYLVPFVFQFMAAGDKPRTARKIWVRQNEMGLQFID